jgi:hypothetical protein
VKHRAVEDFWELYDALPKKIQRLADKNYELLKANPSHPSLDFKHVKGQIWSVRVGLHYRALAYPEEIGFVWFWVGSHAKYDRLIS